MGRLRTLPARPDLGVRLSFGIAGSVVARPLTSAATCGVGLKAADIDGCGEHEVLPHGLRDAIVSRTNRTVSERATWTSASRAKRSRGASILVW
jgi:hypothetical protein